jgi:hypothetical protein
MVLGIVQKRSAFSFRDCDNADLGSVDFWEINGKLVNKHQAEHQKEQRC